MQGWRVGWCPHLIKEGKREMGPGGVAKEMTKQRVWGEGPVGPWRWRGQAHFRTVMLMFLFEFLRWKCPSISLPIL